MTRLYELIESVADQTVANDRRFAVRYGQLSCDIWLGSTHPIGGRADFEPGSMPFSVLLGSEGESMWEADHANWAPAIAKFSGWTPRGAVTFCSNCNGKKEHRALGQLVLAAAELLDGLVDYCGLICPDDSINCQNNGAAAHERVKSWLATMRGKSALVEMRETSHLHGLVVADIEFHRTWMNHPNFFMVK